jgi:hypothetical protein
MVRPATDRAASAHHGLEWPALAITGRLAEKRVNGRHPREVIAPEAGRVTPLAFY